MENSNGSVNEIATTLARGFEGFSSKPYLCPAGYWTIGYGTVYKPDGSAVTADHPPISRATAEQWLASGLSFYMAGVLKASPVLIKYPGSLGALTDFAYNLGTSRYRASTMRGYVDQERWADATVEIHKWRRAGGVILRGLVLRRAAEAVYLGS